MFRFKVFEKSGKPAASLDLAGAYLQSGEQVPIRAELKFSKGELICEPRSRLAASLSIPWPVEGRGRLMLETPRLPERREPYNLPVELARGHLMRISLKREDWGLYDYAPGANVYREVDAARDLLLDAMTEGDASVAAQKADKAIAAAVRAGEAVSGLHAEVFLGRRHSAEGHMTPHFGCRPTLTECYAPQKFGNGLLDLYGRDLAEVFDYLLLPVSWARIEPREGSPSLAALDPWVRLSRERHRELWTGGLLSFQQGDLPSWLKGSSRNYNTLRETIAVHLRQMHRSLGPHVRRWEAVRGLHAFNPFKLNFDQVIDLTRTAVQLTKQAAPRSEVLVGITLPWGEYYAANAQTIPPLLYAEMVLQGGIPLDAFGIEMRFGPHNCDSMVRDLMNISSHLDRFGGFGKPIHVTATGIPSGPAGGGSDDAQTAWIRGFYRIALSKPFVESVCWRGLVDCADDSFAGGLHRADGSAKPALGQLQTLRSQLTE